MASKPTGSAEKRRRVTFCIPRSIDTALEVYASSTGQMKSFCFTEALANYLLGHKKELQAAMDKVASNVLKIAQRTP